MPRKKKRKIESLWLNMERKGELRYAGASTAVEAARMATAKAKQGWKVRVTTTRSSKALMSCEPAGAHARPHARCTMTPAFKKRVQAR